MTTPGRQARTSRVRVVVLALVGALIAASCSDDGQTSPSTTTVSGASSTTSTAADSSTSTSTTIAGTGDPTTGDLSTVGGTLDASKLRLSEGQSQLMAAQPTAVVDGAPLDDAGVQAVIDRLPEWTGDDTLAQPFNWPVESKPPPRAGAVVDVAFPTVDQQVPVEVPVGALHVLRVQPDGDVVIAPFVSITFDQPMVPIATVGQLDAAAVPATITPDVPGHWQWIGTSTLRFDATSDLVDRLPMATEFTVEVPAGTVSATGGVLAEAASFQFATPPVTVQSFQPSGDSLPLVPLFLATFDQRVDPSAVLATVVVKAGGKSKDMRLATPAEVAADDIVRQSTEAVPAGRWIAFRPVDPFTPDTEISIEIGPGTPSAEGPVATTSAASYSGHTYEPLQVVSVECGYGPDCPPSTDIYVTFNNPLDLVVFDPSTVTVDPPLAGLTVGAYDGAITIGGATQGRTTYQVTIPAGLTDVHGQQLAKAVTRSITIGSAAPVLQQFTQPFITLDPLADQPSLSVVTVNHDDFHVRVFSVESKDWPAYIEYVSNVLQGGEQDQRVPGWSVLLDTVVAVDNKQDQATETAVDLSGVLGGKPGHVVVLVETTEKYSVDSNDYWSNRPTATWAQSTSIGIDAFTDNDQLRAWATDLRDGAPLPNVTVQLLGTSPTAVTDEDGLAELALVPQGTSALVATSGDDVALLPASYYGDSWQKWPTADEARWYVFDDRQMYRPGETVSIKGWVRRLTSSSDAQLRLIGADAKVTFTATDGQGNTIGSGTAAVNPLGGFDLTFDVPLGANLGYAYVQLDLGGVSGLSSNSYSHTFQIQEFRRPEFEVAARSESVGPYLSDESVTVAVDATYYSGGPLGAAPVDWQVTTSRSSYSPPGWDEFSFGLWTPWWLGDVGYYSYGSPAYGSSVPSYEGGGCCGPSGSDSTVAQFTGVTDASGTHYLQIDAGGLADDLDGLPVTVTAQATVTDVNRQAWASTTSVLVHSAALYVGLRSDSTFVRQGDPLVIDAIVTDIDGKAVPGRAVQVKAARSESVFQQGTWVDTQVDVQTCDVTSAADAVSCTFTTGTGGTYTISSTITDDKGRTSRSEMTRWVSGADSHPTRSVEQQSLTLVPDLASYQPGDTAELLVQSPFTPGEGLMTISRNGIVSTNRFQIVDGSAVLQIPIADRDLPNLNVSIEVVGATARAADDGTVLPDAPLRPAFATGEITLSISTASRALTVTAVPRADTVVPGQSTQVDVTVTDHNGQPVAGSELAVVVVDEAVLALSNYQLQDPLATFYSQLPAYLTAQYGRQSILLADPNTLVDGQGGAPSATEAPSDTTAASDGFGVPTALPTTGNEKDAAEAASQAAPGLSEIGSDGTPIGVRSNFDALAVFAPEVATDESGEAVVEVPLPDNLTRYRVMVVAVAGDDTFGSDEANITARLPLMVRPSAPRFLNFGDVFALPVTVQNQTDQEMVVDVVMQTANLDLIGGAGQRVTVPANDRVEVRFPVSAAQAGTARFRVAATSGDAADAATIELPVYTPATAEAFATYGVIDDGATLQPVVAPTDVIPQFGGLDITTSSTSLQALTDAVLYISEYPYNSSDAMASRILAIASLRDVLDAFDAPGLPSPATLNETVKSDIDGLVGLQNDDGGFPYWEQNRPSDPYNSIQAAHALVVAGNGGFTVPPATLERALAFLTDIEQYIPSEYSQDSHDSLVAYALNVRNLAGDRDAATAEALFAQRAKSLPLDAVAWLWPVVDDPSVSAKIEKIIQNLAVDTAGAVTFTTEVTDDAYVTLQSDRRTDGLILDALIAVQPSSDLIPKVVAGLLAGQTQGRWDNVQENSFILLAMKRYFDTYESQTPDFVARVWLGDQFAGEHPFVGRSTDRVRISIPTTELLTAGDTGLTIAKVGTGRLYYRIGLRTSPTNLRLDPLERGFVVARSYEAVNAANDVTRDADGTWHIKAGAEVRVRLTMVAESQRTHVALIDPLPAGLEILNATLATTPDVPADPSGGGGVDYSWWYQTWFDHQNMRDDRAEAFANYLPAGVYDYSYVARATTPGTFVTPPARAEEMYAPETFGRGATDTVVIDG